MEKQGRISALMSYAGGHRHLTYASLVMSAISAALSVVPFYYIWLMLKEILDVMPDYSQATDLVHNGWMAVGFTALSVIVYILALMCSHIAAFRITKNMKKKLLDHIVSLSPGSLDMMGSGKARRVVKDSVDATENYMAHQLPDMAGSMTLPLAIVVMLAVFDWRLGVASMMSAVLAFLAMFTMVSSRSLKERMGEYQTALGDVNKEAVEYVRGITVVKTFQQTVDSFQTFKASILRYRDFVINYTVWCRPRMCAFIVASNLSFALIILAAYIICGGTVWTAEFLSDFMFYVIFTPLISVLLMRIMMSSNEGNIVDDALGRMDAILAIEPLPEPEHPAEPDGWDVTFEDVTFTYPGSDKPAISGLNLTMRRGTVTALVGPSGGGKSTIAGLACRFWDPQSGRVCIGGKDLKDIGSVKLGDISSYVFQNNRLFKDTIANNVRLGRPDATDEEVLSALRLAQCEDIIAKMPNGIETMVGPGGTYLSGGEVQRVAIARAVLKDSPVIILDEATAFADPENEYLVQKAFENLTRDKTVLMIAHRLTTVRNADRICVLEEGSISESGTHEELVAKGGTYSRMWVSYQSSLAWKVKGAGA